VQRVFRTPPTIQTAGYRSVNRTIDSLAAEQGVTNINQRGGDGMLLTDWRARKRMAENMEMMGHGEREGMDLGKFFQPVQNVKSFGPLEGALRRDPTTGTVNTVMDGVLVPFAQPKVRVAGVFDGKDAGLPASDAGAGGTP
jgi:hypothetical protein